MQFCAVHAAHTLYTLHACLSQKASPPINTTIQFAGGYQKTCKLHRASSASSVPSPSAFTRKWTACIACDLYLTECRSHGCKKSGVLLFVLAVVINQMTSSLDEQHRVFGVIVDHFISSTSPAQVNIESVMRSHIMGFRTR